MKFLQIYIRKPLLTLFAIFIFSIIVGSSNTTSFQQIQQLTTTVVEKSQTGELSSSLGIKLDVISVVEPEPEPVDPTGGVRATNETGKIAFMFKLNQN